MRTAYLLMTLCIGFITSGCGSSVKTCKKHLQEAERSYVKYVSGANGGKGVYFEISLGKLPSSIQVNKFVVNGVSLPPEQNDSIVSTAIFYSVSPPAEGDLKPEAQNPELFEAENFEAVIHFSHNGVADSVRLKGFTEGEQPPIP